MKVKILKNENKKVKVYGLKFEPENDDEIETLKELWDLNRFLLHRANYLSEEEKIKNISFWIKQKNE